MFSRLSPSARLALYFFFIGSAWILISGRIAAAIAGGKTENLRLIEDLKGLFFIILFSLITYTLSRNIYKKLMRAFNDNKEMLRKYQGVMQATGEGIYEFDIQSGRTRLNENTKEILGTDSNVIEDGRAFWEEHIHPDDQERVFSGIRKVLRNNQQFWKGEYRFRKKDNEYREISHRIYILKEQDKPLSIIGSVQDVTEQRQMQREYLAQQIRNKTEITRNIINAEERERNRWAQELHDNIAQLLGVARLYIGMTVTQPEKQNEIAPKASDLIEKSITEIRQLSANLKPPMFDEEGLKDAIENLMANINRVSKLHFHFRIDEEETNKSLNNEQKLMVYRIIQEQLNNITKYASAQNVYIQVAIQNPVAEVIIRDDGIGFDPQKLVSGIGLKNIRARLNMFNGQLEIISSPGQGCELRSLFNLN